MLLIILFVHRMANFTSEQTSCTAVRTLRQICVDESSRGLFIQQGGLKTCVEIANSELKSVSHVYNTAHLLNNWHFFSETMSP
jgi:hypothetical protein